MVEGLEAGIWVDSGFGIWHGVVALFSGVGMFTCLVVQVMKFYTQCRCWRFAFKGAAGLSGMLEALVFRHRQMRDLHMSLLHIATRAQSHKVAGHEDSHLAFSLSFALHTKRCNCAAHLSTSAVPLSVNILTSTLGERWMIKA